MPEGNSKANARRVSLTRKRLVGLSIESRTQRRVKRSQKRAASIANRDWVAKDRDAKEASGLTWKEWRRAKARKKERANAATA